MAGSYQISGVVRDMFGCESVLEPTSVVVNPLPEVDVFIPFRNLCTDRDTLSAYATQDERFTYSWMIEDEVVGRRDTLTLYPLIPDISELTLMVSDGRGCVTSVKEPLNISVTPMVIPEIPAIDLCEGEMITIGEVNGDAERYNWFVSNGVLAEGSEPTFRFTESGIYNLGIIGTNAGICADTFEAEGFFTVFDSPNAAFEYEANVDSVILGDVQFTSLSTGESAFFWDFGDGTTSALKDPLHVYDLNRPIEVVHVALQENNGFRLCTDTTVQIISPEWITTFFAPDALSPDFGEPEVRLFTPVGLGIIDYEIVIYSPWGEPIWLSTALEDGSPVESWDGRLPSGETAPQGVYIYKAEITFESGNEVTKTGVIHLLR
ncbi:MAG: hypothetical protein AAFR14_12525 [Bacteroidota bacterium]